MHRLIPIDLRRLRLFLAVVDHGTFTRAAAASFISQPALSQAIRELEADLGVALFDRIGRRVHLTAAGDALVEPARQALRDVDTARAAVAAVAGVEAGKVELACLPTLAADPTARLVGAFRSAHPSVTVRLADPDDPADLLTMVRSGVVELGITEQPRGAVPLDVHRLGDQDLLAVFPPGSLPRSKPVRLTQLEGVPIVATLPSTSSRQHLEDAFAEARVSPLIAVEAGQREAIMPLVLAGAGVALMPRPLADVAATLGAAVAEIRPRVARTVVLVHRRGELSPAAEQFRELALRSREKDRRP